MGFMYGTGHPPMPQAGLHVYVDVASYAASIQHELKAQSVFCIDAYCFILSCCAFAESIT